MSNFPRRSARISQQYAQNNTNFHNTLPSSLPSFSSSSSISTTSHPSPINDPSIIAEQEREAFRLHLQAQYLPTQSHFQAPLPSPSACEPSSYPGRSQSQGFFSMPQHTQQSDMQQSPQQQQFAYNQSGQNPGQQATQHHNSFSQTQRPANAHAKSHTSHPGQLPPDFLAEAARRAQMACLMRDLGDVTL